MNNRRIETYRCFLHTLTPVHVGCGQVYEPTEFVVDEANQQLVVFEPLRFYASLGASDRERFSQICLKGSAASILEVYKFLKGRSASGKSVKLARGFLQHYQKTLSIPSNAEERIRQELNRFTIERTAFLPGDGRPYIPGSSVKGALRTSYLNGVAQTKKVPKQKGKFAAKDLEVKLLDGGRFETDPFRLVKISDFKPVGNINTVVLYAVNEKKVPSKHHAGRLHPILEVIEAGSLFIGEIKVEKPHPKAKIRSPISMENLLNSAASFYTKEKHRENEELNQIGITGYEQPSPNGDYPIRLGRHSGAECVTIEGHRDIRIMKGGKEKPSFSDHATTFWLASEYANPQNRTELLPFGWMEIGQRTDELDSEFSALETKWTEKLSVEQDTESPLPLAGEQPAKKVEPTVLLPVEALIKDLSLIAATDMGRIGTVIQKMETLETAAEKARIAVAIKEKIGTKKFKKHKQNSYLQNLIEQGKK